MADGKGCKCAAYDQSECACDADWTPQELIDARAEIERLRLTDAEREAIEEAADTSDVAAEFYSGRSHTRADAAATHAATLRGLLERLSRRSENEPNSEHRPNDRPNRIQ